MEYGIMPAIITPMEDDGVTLKEKALVDVIERMIADGAGSILALGGTGENMAVPKACRKQILDLTVKTVNHRVPVVSGVVELGVHDAMEAAGLAKDCGVDTILVSNPFGAGTAVDGMITFFKMIDSAANLPILIYNFPGRNQFNIVPDLVGRLLDEIPNVSGIKECSEKLDQTAELVSRFGDKMDVLSGNEYTGAWEMLAGAKGAILASANVICKEWVEVLHYAEKKDAVKVNELAMKYLPFQKTLFKSPNPGPVKYAMSLMGIDAGKPLVPCIDPPQAVKDEVKAGMKALGLI